ncbi:trigger factor [Nonomuraea ferruginea]
MFPVSQPDIEVTKIEDGEQIEFTAEVDIRPNFDVPDYQGVEITVDSAEVADSDVGEQLDALRQRFATLTGVERPAAVGDYVVMDLRAEIDGENIEEQQASEVSYEVGAGSVLQGLGDALVGMSADEEKSFRTELVGGENSRPGGRRHHQRQVGQGEGASGARRRVRAARQRVRHARRAQGQHPRAGPPHQAHRPGGAGP